VARGAEPTALVIEADRAAAVRFATTLDDGT